MEILALSISQIRQGAKRMTAVYHLTLRTRENRIVEQSYVGYAPRDEHPARDYRAIAARASVEPAIGRSVALLPEANLIFVASPNDRRMALLSERDLRLRVRSRMRTLVPGLPRRGTWHVEDAHLTVLRYVPDKRITSRCWGKLVDAAGVEHPWSFIAKQYADRGKATMLFRALRALEGRRSATRFDVAPATAAVDQRHFVSHLPRALALDHARAIVFIEEARGKELLTALSEVDPEIVIPAVGKSLALLHLMPASVRTSVPKRVSTKTELAETRAVLADIVGAHPNLRERAGRLLADLSRPPVHTGALTVLLHGSFRLNHVFLDDRTLTLLDLESLRRGHPAYDIANLLSSLHYAELETRLDSAARRQITRAFLRGYLATVPWRLDAAVLLWFLATLLISKQAGKYVRHLHGDREEKVPRMLALAEATLATAAALRGRTPAQDLWTLVS